MRPLRLLAASATASGLLLLPTGCCGPGTPPVTWTITPSATAAVNDGNTPTYVTATIIVGGQPVPDGSSVTLGLATASAASFSRINQNNLTATQSTSLSTTNGQVTVQIYDLAVESVLISLTGSADYSTTSAPFAGTTSVHFGGSCTDSQVSPVAVAGSGSGIPEHVIFHCNDQVMGGSFGYQQRHLYEGNTQDCTAFVGDANDQAVGNAAVQFLTEAGALETDVVQFGQHPTMITDPHSGEAQVSFHVQTPYPEDVPYDATLDGYFDPCPSGQTVGCNTMQRTWTDATGHQYNPRDGWVTMIAATPGQLPGGGPTTIPEPYVDSNDNGQWDPGEPYLDVNCDGKFNSSQTPDSNGFVRIWNSTTVIWTDLPYPTTADATQLDAAAVTAGVVTSEIPSLENPPGCAGPSSPTLAEGSTCNMVFRFVDKNANLPSAMQSGNVLTGSTASDQCTIKAPSDYSFDNSYAEHLLAITDVPLGAMNDSPPPNPSQGLGPFGYTYNVSATFNYSDTGPSENGTLGLSPTQTVTFGITGTCMAPQ